MIENIDKIIENNIHLIRGQKVMLDRDLAELFGVETKRLKEQVKRNIDRFPEHFMFEMSKEEDNSLRSQIATLKRGQHQKYLSTAFTEHGVLMLANVLKSKRAIDMSIKIIDTFVKMREIIYSQKDILLKLELIEKQTIGNSEDIKNLFEVVYQLIKDPEEERTRIGFKI